MGDGPNETDEALEKIAQFQKDCAIYGLAISTMGIFTNSSSLVLVKAQEHRNLMMAEPEITRWLQAMAEVFSLLRVLQDGFAADKTLSQVSFLLDRVRLDIESIAELTMGGSLSPAFDVIRDLIEIESLLKDFLAYPGNMEEWLSGKHPGKFYPVEMRKREQLVTDVPIEEMRSKHIYSAHSEALHVNPALNSNALRGVQVFNKTKSKAPFYDLFYHLAGLVPVLMLYGKDFAEPQKGAVAAVKLDTFHTVLSEVAEVLRAMTDAPQREETDS